jgi:uncharacterized protein YacL
MFLVQLIRIALAVLCGFISYHLAYGLIPPQDDYFIRDFPHIVITVLAIIYGYFGLPYAFVTYRKIAVSWLFNFIKNIIGDTLQDFYSRVTVDSPKNSKVKERKVTTPTNSMVLDTSAIIDGRIYEVCKTGFLYGSIIVPQFVISELRYLADSPDTLKRSRARRGLDLLNEMKKFKMNKDGVAIKVVSNDYEKVKKVDDKLLKVSKSLKASLITTDYNLNKNATAQGLKVLNINELVNSVKIQALPGENMSVKIVQEGKEKEQGVGYLDDGTMVVVEKGGSLVGETVQTQVSRIIQTNAGKMIFTQINQNE